VAVLTVLLPLSGCAGGGEAGRPATALPTGAVGDPTGAQPVPDGLGRAADDDAILHVGALFHAAGEHFCSGTLVSGAGAGLVVTAAHCVAPGPGRATYDDLEFAPAYRRGAAPYGRWKAARITVDPRWSASADPGLDVAFIELASPDGRSATDLVGADRIGFLPPTPRTVRLTGYPKGSDDPLTCVGTAGAQGAGQLRVACTGFGDGTSGSPWLADWDPATGTGTVIGVIGGYQLGGDTDDVSYAAYVGADVQRLYHRAVAARP
jgi:V8-like Glu-specific endopeptidase